MPFFEMPEFQIAPGDDLDTAELKLRSAFEEAEIDFSGMAWVNSRLPKTIADVCRFFWSRVGKEMCFTPPLSITCGSAPSAVLTLYSVSPIT